MTTSPNVSPGRRSVTSTRSFQARLLDAERWRLGLMGACLAFVLGVWLLRRALGGEVASHAEVFIPIVSILVSGLAVLAGAYVETCWRARRGRALPWWRLIAGVAFDLAVAFGILLVLHFRSPRGELAALSAPSLLLVPIVIMLSVLRLRPRFSLLTGLGAAAAHLALAADTYHKGDIDVHLLPLMGSYGVLLALTGAVAAVLARIVRRYIHEAVAEAEAAERASTALSIVEHELDIARDVQRSLLPSEPPAFAGFDVAGLARPATQAGGDYYDWQPLSDGRLIVAIADVTGHGIGPALVMAVCRAYSRATAQTARNAADLLERINTLIAPDLSSGRFITMAVAVVSPDGAVELLSAGHGPTFLFRAATGQVEQFGGNGLPLGVAAGEQYTAAAHVQMQQGDALVLLTDGFMERMAPDNSMFGIQRLVQAIATNANRPAAELIAAIDHAATQFAGGAPQGDDMTAVVLRRYQAP